MTSKIDQRAAERLLKKAVDQAIHRLRGPDHRADVFEINRHEFETAIHAADMFLMDEAR